MPQTNVSNVHADYARRRQQWSRVRDALAGQDEIKNAGEAYLRRPDGMSSAAYAAYLSRAQYYPVVERTLRGMSGMVFRRPAEVELPRVLTPLIEAATVEGHSLGVMAENLVNEVLSIGRYGILVDYAPVAPVGAIPHLATYTAENISDWRVQLVNGVRKLTRVIVRDDFDVDDEDLNADAETRLELILNDEGNYEVRRWVAMGAEHSNDRVFALYGDPIVPIVNGAPLTTIPFTFVNAYDLRPEVEKPPMLDLVDVSIGHFRNSADYEHALYLTAQPTPVVAGSITEKNKPRSIGSGSLWILPEGATAQYLEFSGAGIAAQREAMQDKEARMASLGARMIHDGQNRNESADTARMRGKGEMSLLMNVVSMAEAGLTQVLRTTAEWAGADPDEVKVMLNRDWIETRLDAQSLSALVKAWQAGAVSHQTLFDNLRQGEITPSGRTFDEEKELIEEEGGDVSLVVPRLAPPNLDRPPPPPTTE